MMKKIILIGTIILIISGFIYARESFSNKQNNDYRGKNDNSSPRKSEYFNLKEVRAGAVLLNFKDGVSEERRINIFQGITGINVQHDKFLNFYIISSESKTTAELLDYFNKQAEVLDASPDQKVQLNIFPADEHFGKL